VLEIQWQLCYRVAIESPIQSELLDNLFSLSTAGEGSFLGNGRRSMVFWPSCVYNTIFNRLFVPPGSPFTTYIQFKNAVAAGSQNEYTVGALASLATSIATLTSELPKARQVLYDDANTAAQQLLTNATIDALFGMTFPFSSDDNVLVSFDYSIH
jgi:hypothetical protein